jgi:hypothetical protein
MIRPAPAAFQRPALQPHYHNPPWGIRSHETSTKGSLTFTRPIFLSPVIPGWNEDPLAFPRAPHPAVTSNARRGENQPHGHWLELHHRHRRPSFDAATHYRATSRRTPTLRRAGQARREPAVLFNNPGPQEPADQTQHLTVGDAIGHQAHQDLMIDIIKTGGDITLDHPLIALGGEFVNLGDGILGPPSRQGLGKVM